MFEKASWVLHLMDGRRSMKSWNARYFRSRELDRRLASTHPQSACSAAESSSPLSDLAPSSPCRDDCHLEVQHR